MSSEVAVQVEIAPGELIDRITILEIKSTRMKDSQKLRNVAFELQSLTEVRDRKVVSSPEIDRLTAELKQVNEALWDVEDQIRQCERCKDFGDPFIQLARSVYHANDRRAEIKKQINQSLGSRLIEEKEYVQYAAPSAGAKHVA